MEFDLSGTFREVLKDKFSGNHIPKTAIFTRYYDGHFDIEYDAKITDDPVKPTGLEKALDESAKGARRTTPSPEQNEEAQTLRTTLANWADAKKAEVTELQDLRTDRGVKLITAGTAGSERSCSTAICQHY